MIKELQLYEHIHKLTGQIGPLAALYKARMNHFRVRTEKYNVIIVKPKWK